ncbi:MAG: PorP/SprF family type IX secretion system membrane protein [Bacteroidales bacterium]|nr:PorP/SprF family type IX secretion system membrane protein [Bacteroidales bacterium]
MKKNIFISIFLILTFFTSITKAQELKNYNLYFQNPVLFNPAFAINDNFLTAYSNSHLQWASLIGAPRSYDIGASMNFFPNMGAGFSVTKTQHGLFNNLYANAKYGYQLKIGNEQFLKMGVSFGIASNKVISQNAENVDLSDVNLTSEYYNKTVFTSGVGFAYKIKDFNAQITMPQLFEYNALNMYSIGVFSYDYHFNDNLDFLPSVVLRGAKESPFQFDGNFGAKWRNMIWAQVGYRSSNSLIFSVGVDISNYSIGYAYQADMNPINTGSAGSHEIQIIFKLNNNDKSLITPKVNLFGVVTSNLDDQPIASQITIYEDNNYVGKITTPSQTGDYSIELEPEKTYKITVTARGFEQKDELITIPQGVKDFEYNIQLISKDALISGITSNKIINIPAEAEIMFLENNRVIKTVNSDNNGNYSVVLPSNKTYKIIVRSANYQELDSAFVVPQGTQKMTQDFALTPNISLVGKITDVKTNEPISAKIELYNNTTDELVASIQSDADGNYSLNIPLIQNFSVSVSADNYFFQTDNFDVDFLTFQNEKNFALQPLEVGASIILKNIFFDTGKSDLRTESYTEINRLIFVMVQNPTLNVKISGHTDNTGTDVFNLQLSKDRAQSVVNYMVSKGIKADRLKAEGYGSSRPIDTNATDEGKQNNRRVEAEIF